MATEVWGEGTGCEDIDNDYNAVYASGERLILRELRLIRKVLQRIEEAGLAIGGNDSPTPIEIAGTIEVGDKVEVTGAITTGQ